MFSGLMFGVGLFITPIVIVAVVWFLAAVFYKSKHESEEDLSEYSDY